MAKRSGRWSVFWRDVGQRFLRRSDPRAIAKEINTAETTPAFKTKMAEAHNANKLTPKVLAQLGGEIAFSTLSVQEKNYRLKLVRDYGQRIKR